MPVIDDKYIANAESIFYAPKTLYAREEIVSGVKIVRVGKSPATMSAVAGNTFRGYHGKNKSCVSASKIFKEYFTENHFQIIESLKNRVSTEADLNIVSNKIMEDLLPELLEIIKEEQLASYNKVRKPIDLYLEHLIAMAEDIDSGLRRRLISLLFLPLDSWIFRSEEIFSVEELRQHGFRRKSTYSCVFDEKAYNDLQELLKNKAKENSRLLNRQFHRIYFDMLWNNRYRRTGNNLFECN